MNNLLIGFGHVKFLNNICMCYRRIETQFSFIYHILCCSLMLSTTYPRTVPHENHAGTQVTLKDMNMKV